MTVGRFGGVYTVTMVAPPWWRPRARRRYFAARRERARVAELKAAGFAQVELHDEARGWAEDRERVLRRERFRRGVIEGRL